MTGIGFLGASAIIREHGRVGGLTTATTIWRMGIGAGELVFVAASTLIVIIVLLVFPRLETWIDHIRKSRSYKIVISTGNMDTIDRIQDVLETCDLKVFEHHQSKISSTIIGTRHTIGSPKNHDKFVIRMLKDKDIEEFVY